MIKPYGLLLLSMIGGMSFACTAVRKNHAQEAAVYLDPTPGEDTIEDKILEKAGSSKVVMFGETHRDAEGNLFSKNAEYVSRMLPYLKHKGYGMLGLEVDARAQPVFESYFEGKITEEAAIKRSIESIACVEKFEGNQLKLKEASEQVMRKNRANHPEKMAEYKIDLRDSFLSEAKTKLKEAKAAYDCGMKVVLIDDWSFIGNENSDELYKARDELWHNRLRGFMEKGEKVVVHCGCDHLRKFDKPYDSKKFIRYILENNTSADEVLRVGLQQRNIKDAPEGKKVGIRNAWVKVNSDLQLLVEDRLEALDKYQENAE